MSGQRCVSRSAKLCMCGKSADVTADWVNAVNSDCVNEDAGRVALSREKEGGRRESSFASVRTEQTVLLNQL